MGLRTAVAKRKKHPGAKARPRANRPKPQDGWGLRELYQHACGLAQRGEAAEAGRVYGKIRQAVTDPRLKALVCNDLAALAAQAGDIEAARAGFEEALALDPQCDSARLNLALLLADLPAPPPGGPVGEPAGAEGRVNDCPAPRATKVAVLSFLFNWPSTGGGIVHTVELAHFLLRAGYDVRHFHARYAPWDIGRVGAALPFPSEVLEFDEAGWNVPAIQERFREAVSRFSPDHVLVTDSWNMKPLLAEAVRAYPYFLRLQAMECLCPLNNVRLLPEPGGQARQCPLHQLATPDACGGCLQERGHLSGGLHAAER
ncbi:MAG TPA: hypothetical protein VJ739_09655, partial [Gemmataceae bacterium]|nr:hypothetical protein [Gemmataceae bacterium]